MAAKFGQTKGLWVKCEAPGFGRGLFFLSILIIADGGELTCQLYFLLFEWVRSFGGLTCDFWAVFEEIFF